MVVTRQSESREKAILCESFIPSPARQVPVPDAAVGEDREALNFSGLLGMLELVTDPRDPRGKRHALAFVLAVCVVATLAGA